MAKISELEMLQALRILTPRPSPTWWPPIPLNPLCLGLYNPWTENWYTDQTIRCMYPRAWANRRLCGHLCLWIA